MKILFISRYLPDDPQKVHGTFKRIATFIEAFKDIAELDVLFFTPPDYDCSEGQISRLKEFITRLWNADVRLYLYPMSKFNMDNELMKWISFTQGIFSFSKQRGRIEFSSHEQVRAVEECLGLKPDVIFAHRLSSMCPLLLTKKPLPPIFFDLDDIEHIVLKRYIESRNNLKTKLLYSLLPSLTKGEYNAIELASKTAVCSELDRSYLNEKYGLSGVVTVPNAVDIPRLEPITSEPNLLFLGSIYQPNVDAAHYLVERIWPLVRKKLPQAKLIIAGTSAEKMGLKTTGADGVETPGFVDDLADLYRKVRATAVPILVGGGTRFKIIEAAAYGKPTVATTIGAEGLEFEEGTEILRRDDPETFADACVSLLTDTHLCEKIGLAAREKTIEIYDRQNVIKRIKEHIADMLEARL
ncbi:MAG: glycosyltransferase [Thermodesulfobacteriota bacterium]